MTWTLFLFSVNYRWQKITVSTPQLIICSRNPNSQYHQFPISALIFIEDNVPLAIIKHFPRLVCRKLIRKMTVTSCRQSERESRNDVKRGNDSINSTSMACVSSRMHVCLSIYIYKLTLWALFSFPDCLSLCSVTFAVPLCPSHSIWSPQWQWLLGERWQHWCIFDERVPRPCRRARHEGTMLLSASASQVSESHSQRLLLPLWDFIVHVWGFSTN